MHWGATTIPVSYTHLERRETEVAFRQIHRTKLAREVINVLKKRLVYRLERRERADRQPVQRAALKQPHGLFLADAL